MKLQDSPAAKPRDSKKTTQPAKRRSNRKASYRPLQTGLVVASFVASFMGATWLQAQDLTVDSLQESVPVSVQSTAAAIAESSESLAILAPTATPVVPTVPQADAEFGEVEAEEASADAVISVPQVVLPTTTPVPEPTVAPTVAPTAVPTTRVPNVVARSRSSR